MAVIFFTALTLGILGSFHCIGMCGPLAFSLPLDTKNDLTKFAGSFLYNTGRIITYSILGLLFGFVGKSFSLFGFQQWLSIALGIVILFFVLIPRQWMPHAQTGGLFTKYTHSVRARLARLFLKKNYGSLVTIGLLNGLLPCGMVYMAVAAAIATANPLQSSFFMLSFGIGTLPVMWSISFFGNYINLALRKKIRSAYPAMMTLMACLLIMRGMGLGIPYISPVISQRVSDMQICYPVIKNLGHNSK